MTVTGEEQNSSGRATAIQSRAGLTRSNQEEFRAGDGVITITPTDNDEYTPEQRRIIDAQLAEAGNGPFRSPLTRRMK
jgi:hypothetical protein